MLESTLHPTQWAAFEREYNKCLVTETGCRIWQGRVEGTGYATFRFTDRVSRNQRDIGARRLAYMRWGHDEAIDTMRKAFGVMLPDRLHLRSTCGNRLCVEPTHTVLRSRPTLQRFRDMQG